MESDENSTETNVPRFLDDLEMIDRKRIRLDSRGKQRWSLTEKREDTQVLAEMGVAPLDGNLSPDEEPGVSEDIENRSPNLRNTKTVKKSYLQTVLSPVNKHINDNVFKENVVMSRNIDISKQEGLTDSCNAKSNSLTNCLTHKVKDSLREEQVISKDLSKKNAEEIDKERFTKTNEKISERCKDGEQIVDDSFDLLKCRNDGNVEDSGAAGSVLEGVVSRKKNSVKKGERKRCSELDKEAKKPKVDHCVDTYTASSSHSTDGNTEGLAWSENPECLSSPHTTCGPHPALHRPLSSIPRHTTFDGTNGDSKENLELEYEANFDSYFNEKRTIQCDNENETNSEQKTTNNQSETNTIRTHLNSESNSNLEQDKTIDSQSKTTDNQLKAIDSQSKTIDNQLNTIDSQSKTIDSQDATDGTNDFENGDSEQESKASARNTEEKYYPLSSVDQVILDYTEEDELEQTMLQNRGESDEYFRQTEEMECFSSHDRSFCGSCNRRVLASNCGQGQTPESDCGDEDGSIFSKLSDEVILSILQWLPKRTIVRCMHVCKRWRRLAADGRLWARVDLGGRMLPSGALPILMGRHPVVLRLANSQLLEPVIPQPVSIEWRVQFLDLSTACVSSTCITSILLICPTLIKLSLEALALEPKVHRAFSKLTQLRALNLSQVTGFTKRCVSAVATLPRIEHLNVAWTRMDDGSLRTLADSLPSSVQRLNLAGCRKTLTDGVVSCLVSRCPNLVELDISDAAAITGLSMQRVAALKSLEHLALSRCYMLQLRDYITLEKCPSLQWVDAFGILPPLNMVVLQKNLPHVQLNKFMHSSIARPTVGNRRTSIWGLRTRD